jgi:transglutaminase-like putative cysteine protease
MTLEGTHKFVLHAICAVGIAPLGLSGELPTPVVIATYLALAWSWFSRVPREANPKAARIWTGVVVAAFVAAATAMLAGELLLPPVLFGLVLVVTRLLQSRSSRHVFQLYGLTFVAMIAGAVMNPMLSFLFLFLLYVVLLVWGLVLLHLQRDLEQLARQREVDSQERAREGWQAQSVIRPGFLAGSSVLALLVFAGSLGIFFMFPRLGMGFFYQQGRRGDAMSGFSDSIELGHFGTLKDSYQVVMRVDLLDDGAMRTKKLRLRGIGFDHYDGRSWSKSAKTKETFPMRQSAPGEWVVGDWRRSGRGNSRPPVERGPPTRYQVYLEPIGLGERMVFGIPKIDQLAITNYRIDALKKERTSFVRDLAEDVSTKGRADVALTYIAVSDESQPNPEALAKAEEPMPDRVADLYLQLPGDLDPRFRALATELAAAEPTPHAKVMAIQRHLRTYRYTLEGGHDPRDPLADFVFGRKAGHCEYFASAMVVMLRTLGIPARPANGFYGGAFNEYGLYYAMRQADAHSWVEVWFPGYGWLTFDPTPPGGGLIVPPEGGVWGALEAWLDNLRLHWFRWVVEYDLEKQFQVFRDLAASMQGILPSPRGAADDPRAWAQGAKEWAQDPRSWVKVGGIVVALVFLRFGALPLLGLLRRWLRRRRGDGPRPEELAYARMLRLLARQGIGRAPAETPRELCGRVEALGYRARTEVALVTRAFETVRFGGLTSGGAELGPALTAIRRVAASGPSLQAT